MSRKTLEALRVSTCSTLCPIPFAQDLEANATSASSGMFLGSGTESKKFTPNGSVSFSVGLDLDDADAGWRRLSNQSNEGRPVGWCDEIDLMGFTEHPEVTLLGRGETFLEGGQTRDWEILENASSLVVD